MRRYLACIAGSAILILSGCSSSRHEPNEKYYLVAANIKVPYWVKAGEGLVQAAQQLGVQAQMVGPDSHDAQAEAQELRNLIAKKPAGILVSAAEPNVLQAPIDEAIAQGIPVIAIDADSPRSKRLVFIGTNNYEAGRMGARKAAELLGRKGSAIVFTIPGQGNLEDRLHGYRDVFGDSIKITQVVDIRGDPRVAFDTTTDLISKAAPPDAFICLEAVACKEVAEVLNRKKVTGRVIVAMDTDQDTVDWIKKGGIQATVAQKPFTMAYYGVKMLDDLHHYKPKSLTQDWQSDTRSPIPTFVDTGASLIDKGNVDALASTQQTAMNFGR